MCCDCPFCDRSVRNYYTERKKINGFEKSAVNGEMNPREELTHRRNG